MENLHVLKTLLQSPKNVVVVTHFKPDADALGSSLGLAGYLKRKGHRVTVITPSDYPDFLSWMSGNEEVLALSSESPENEEKAKVLIGKADVLFCLDFSSPKRTEHLEASIRAAGGDKVLIDHHLEPENFAVFMQWDDKAASTAGLVFQLINDLGDKHLIDSSIANCLYAGVMTDTGGFRHANTTQQEFQIAAELTGMGANPADVAKKIYDTNSIERLRLTGFVLNEKLSVLPEYNTAYIAISAKELSRFNGQTGDTEGLVNFGLSIKGIRLSVMLIDRKEEIKLSLRSLGDFSVNEMARKHFNGGGHKNAAGGSSKESLDETVKKLLNILKDYKNELNA